jgi:hypothetical protein
MGNNIYIQNESKKDFKDWTIEGLSFLLQHNQHNDLAIHTLSKFLDIGETVEFIYNELYYEIFESADSGYIVNVYTSNEKDEYGCYLDKYNIDGGLCSGSSKDAITFML